MESDRFKAFAYHELVVGDKTNLDIAWLRDESLEDMDNLPATEVIAREMVEHLTAALAEFDAVAAELELAAEEREAATDADHDADERYTRADLEAMAVARSSTWRPKPDTPQTKSMAWTRRS